MDLILVRHATIKNVLHTRSYHSTDCDTDHSRVCCKFRLQPKMFHHAKKPGNPHIDVSKMTQPDLIEQFTEAFEEEYDASQSGDTATEKWITLQDTFHCIALDIFGKKTSKLHDWYEAKSSGMTPIIVEKCALHLPSTSSHPLSGTYRYSGLPGTRPNALPGAVPMHTGQSTVR